MLAIRLQRLGRKAYPVYRVAVQEAQRHPSSGRVVAYVGSYNPHTKEANINKEEAQKYLDNGAQPTPRVVKLLVAAGVALPKWVKQPDASKQKSIRNPEKLRKNQPKEEAETEEAPADA
ncbi:MAG: 30S ribosomal protein S16 [Candidatus Saccharimonas sp.]